MILEFYCNSIDKQPINLLIVQTLRCAKWTQIAITFLSSKVNFDTIIKPEMREIMKNSEEDKFIFNLQNVININQ
jgi:hypothetical protein